MFRIRILILLAFLLTGCGPAAQRTGGLPIAGAATPGGQNTNGEETLPSLTALPSSTTALPAVTATAKPTETFTPSPSPTLEPTATPTPFPMSIEALRARNYPGSPITVEQELDPGPNYHRYYAYYLSDGLKIYGLLTVPYGDPPSGGWPAIVFNHGYIPPSVYHTTERYVAYVDNLARSGYIVYKIDYRGHDRSEGVAGGAYGDPGYTIDVLNAVASIKQFPQANPEKIGMWGHSMGGYLTLRAMVISPDIKVGVIWGGVVGDYSNMMYHWRRTGPAPTPQPGTRRWRTDWINEFGTPEQNPAFWNSISANSYLADLSGPLQLHHSVTDEEVPVEWSETLEKQVQAVGKTVELYTYPGDNHNISGSFSTAMARTIEFFNKYLQN